MNKITLMLPLMLVALASGASGQYIVGSDHDFSGQGWSGGQICVPCHTPHNAYPYAQHSVTAVLWNHEETSQTFTMYVTEAGNTGSVDGTSKLCLSCHDGVTAVDNYGGLQNNTTYVTGSAVVGIDLTDDHPIGVQYPPEDQGGSPLPGYNDPPLGNIRLPTVATVPRVECTSCHSPHGTQYTFMLRDNIASSQICLNCHAL